MPWSKTGFRSPFPYLGRKAYSLEKLYQKLERSQLTLLLKLYNLYKKSIVAVAIMPFCFPVLLEKVFNSAPNAPQSLCKF